MKNSTFEALGQPLLRGPWATIPFMATVCLLFGCSSDANPQSPDANSQSSDANPQSPDANSQNPDVPAQFSTGDWSVTNPATDGDLDIVITALPSDSGLAITDLGYQLDAGAWVSLGATTTGTYGIAGLSNGLSYAITIRAVNGLGNGTAAASKSQTPTAGSAFSKATIEALLSDPTQTGRQSTNPLKIPGVDALPPGVSLNGTTINVTGTGIIFEDWDFSGFFTNVQSGADVTAIRNCLYDMDKATQPFYSIRVNLNAYVRLAEWNTIDGGDYLSSPVWVNGGGSGTNDNSGIQHIRRNRFVNVSSDAIKASGTADDADNIIELNYFGPPKAWPNVKANWSAATTYQRGEVAFDGTGAFAESYISKLDGNTGNVLINGPWWQKAAPHADAIQWGRNNSCDTIIRWNYFDWQATDFNRGVTTAVYVQPIGGVGNSGEVRVYENVISTTVGPSPYAAFPRPIIGNSDAISGGFFIYNNWLQEKAGYVLMTVGGNTISWGTNWQLANDAAIAHDDSRLPGGMTNWSASTPVLGADWP